MPTTHSLFPILYILCWKTHYFRPRNLEKKRSKIGLKFSVCAPITSDFDREYLRNGRRYRKSVKRVIDETLSHVSSGQKIGELWSTNNKVIGAHMIRKLMQSVADWPHRTTSHGPVGPRCQPPMSLAIIE